MKQLQAKWVDENWGTRGVHDPTIIQKNQRYYMYSTDTHDANDQPTSGVQIRTSMDLIHWQYFGEALSGVPQAAQNWSQAQGLWAPEVKKIKNHYVMYYSASTFGSKKSCIGLAISDSPEGPWKDQGIVVKTDGRQQGQNSIDANLVQDKDGAYWLVYGSFFGGIFIVRINSETGFTMKQDDTGIRIAQRPQSADNGAIEGCFVHYNQEQDYYYLFMSYDSLTWSYHVRVARSKSVTGPYMDINGRDVCYPVGEEFNSIGTKILGSYQFSNEFPWIAPGHNSIFEDADKNCYMVHHVRDKKDQNDSYGFIRQLFWLDNGWPVVSPNYISTNEDVVLETHIFGAVEAIEWPDTSELIVAKHQTIDDKFYDDVASSIAIQSYDWENQRRSQYELGYFNGGKPFWLKL